MKTVALIEGFAGGPRLTKKFRLSLHEAGFRIIKTSSRADVIIAHSAGCYNLPLTSDAQLIMLIGLPYWPGRSIYSRNRRDRKAAKAYELSHFGRQYFIRKRLLQAYYFLIRPKYFWLALVWHTKLAFVELLSDKKVIFVRNSDDNYLTPKIKKSLAPLPNIKYFELPGQHDDYYTNPAPYIEILLKEL